MAWVQSAVARRHGTSQILDVGFVGDQEQPGLHLGLRRESPCARIVGVDVDVDGVLRHRLPNTLIAEGEELPFKDGVFDAVLCTEVLEHLHSPGRLLREMGRVLKRDGDLVITTPNAWAWGTMLRYWMIGSMASRVQRHIYRGYLGDRDHKQFYDPLSLMSILDDAGFRTVDIATKNHAVPFVRRWFKRCGVLDWQFYPMDRLGAYLCLIARNSRPRGQGAEVANSRC